MGKERPTTPWQGRRVRGYSPTLPPIAPYPSPPPPPPPTPSPSPPWWNTAESRVLTAFLSNSVWNLTPPPPPPTPFSLSLSFKDRQTDRQTDRDRALPPLLAPPPPRYPPPKAPHYPLPIYYGLYEDPARLKTCGVMAFGEGVYYLEGGGGGGGGVNRSGRWKR